MPSVSNSPVSPAPGSGFDIRQYLGVLRARRRLSLLVGTAIAIGAIVASIAFNFISPAPAPRYQTEVQIFLRPLPNELSIDAEARLIESPEIAEAVVRDLQLDQSPERVTSELKTATGPEILVLTYTANERDLSIEVPTAFADEYVSLRGAQAATARRNEARRLARQIAALEARLRAIDSRGQQSDEATRTALVLEIANLAKEAAASRTRPPEAGRAEIIGTETKRLTSAGGGISPSKGLAAGLLLGIACGLGSAFAAEFLADRFRTRAEISRICGAPILAIVPEVGDEETMEAFRQAREAVGHLASPTGFAPLLITSAGSREGRTSVAVGLARAFAEAGKAVTLVGSDLRHRDLDERFGLTGEGLADAVSRGSAVVATKVENDGDLKVVSGGDAATDSAAVVGSPRLASVLDAIGEGRDVTILDSPAVLESADALAFARTARAVVLVVDAQRGRRGRTAEARDALASVGANILGCIVTNFDPSKSPLDHATAD